MLRIPKTVDRARREIVDLEQFVKLAEEYEATTLEKLIIKEYAFLGSVNKVVLSLENIGCKIDDRAIEHKDVIEVIKSKPMDDLHKIIKSAYLYKTRALRSR